MLTRPGVQLRRVRLFYAFMGIRWDRNPTDGQYVDRSLSPRASSSDASDTWEGRRIRVHLSLFHRKGWIACLSFPHIHVVRHGDDIRNENNYKGQWIRLLYPIHLQYTYNSSAPINSSPSLPYYFYLKLSHHVVQLPPPFCCPCGCR